MSCQYCNKRQAVNEGYCPVCLFLYSEEEVQVHQTIVDDLFKNVPTSVCMSVDELTDFVVRCLPYTDTYKILNEEILSNIASYVVNRSLPEFEEVIIDVEEEIYDVLEVA